MRYGNLILVTAALIAIRGLLACGPPSANMPSLSETKATTEVASGSEESDSLPSDEDKMMVFTQCMRDQGIELMDPEVDADGNVLHPVPAEGIQVIRAEMQRAYEVCGTHLEGVSLGREDPNMTQVLDAWLALSACMREKGYDVDDPDPSNPAEWRSQLTNQLDMSDPKVQEALQDCNRQSQKEME